MKTENIKKLLIADAQKAFDDLYEYEDQVFFHNVRTNTKLWKSWHLKERNFFPKIINIADKMIKVGARCTEKTITVQFAYSEFGTTISGNSINYQIIFEKIVHRMVELGCFAEYDDVEYDNRYGKNLKISDIGYAVRKMAFTF